MELADLEKEYLLILARLNLLQFDKNSSAVVGKEKVENIENSFMSGNQRLTQNWYPSSEYNMQTKSLCI